MAISRRRFFGWLIPSTVFGVSINSKLLANEKIQLGIHDGPKFLCLDSRPMMLIPGNIL